MNKARAAKTVSAIMARVRSRNTGPERQLSKMPRRLNYKFSKHNPNLPGRPDICFSDSKLAVFVDGDFWHGRQWRNRGLRSLSAQFRHSPNKQYWVKKITANMRRDARVRRGYGGRVRSHPVPTK